RVGDLVTAGEALLEVQSDKANVEVESTASGKLAQVLAEEGALLHSGAPLAVITDPGEALDAALLEQALQKASESNG
ncbi:MAG: lipoyl domain-containing protein, partial [Chloroflexota bacterium]